MALPQQSLYKGTAKRQSIIQVARDPEICLELKEIVALDTFCDIVCETGGQTEGKDME